MKVPLGQCRLVKDLGEDNNYALV